jgi:hypothetical protein
LSGGLVNSSLFTRDCVFWSRARLFSLWPARLRRPATWRPATLGQWELNQGILSRSAAMKHRDLQCSGARGRDKMGWNFAQMGANKFGFWRHFRGNCGNERIALTTIDLEILVSAYGRFCPFCPVRRDVAKSGGEGTKPRPWVPGAVVSSGVARSTCGNAAAPLSVGF